MYINIKERNQILSQRLPHLLKKLSECLTAFLNQKNTSQQTQQFVVLTPISSYFFQKKHIVRDHLCCH